MLVPGALLLTGLLFTGCYRYVPVEPSAVGSAENVRVRLRETAAHRLANDYGANITTLNGQFAPLGADSLAVSIRLSRFTDGMSFGDTRQTLVFGRSEILDVSRRELSVGRTALATAGVLAGFAILVSTMVQLGDDNPGAEEPPPPPPAAAQRVFRIPIPLGNR